MLQLRKNVRITKAAKGSEVSKRCKFVKKNTKRSMVRGRRRWKNIEKMNGSV